MEFDLWGLLLLPVFFGLGWFAARVDMRAVLKQAQTVPGGFLRALAALVEDKTDVAASALAEAARQHPNAFELQRTLGQLYRKRGENDRAIQLHQQMSDSPDLPAAWRDNIRYEMAQDFRKAGLVDRAEEILLKLLDGNMGLAARKDLLEIYQQDRDWQKAIQTARELSSDANSFQHEIAQFHCELAQTELYKSNYADARAEIDAALAANRKCVRATLLAGDLEFAQGHYQQAIDIWQTIEQQNFDYLPMAAEKLCDAYEKLGRPTDGLALLRGYAKTFPQLDLTDALYKKIATFEGEEPALEAVRESVHANPTLLGIYRLVGARSTSSLSPDKRSDAELARTVLSKHVQRVMLHRCRCCNFRSRTFFWHCPACGEWESLTPNRSEIQL